MKVMKSIVSKDNELIGFLIKGTEREFGGFGENDIEKTVKLDEMYKIKFHNSQIDMSTGRIRETKEFRINSIPTLKYIGNNFIEVDCSIYLTDRILKNGKLIGFKVIIDEVPNKYRYEDVLKLSTVLRPGNFVVRHTSNKSYIAGKQGVLQLEDLPEIHIGEKVEKDAKPSRKRTSTGGELTEVIQGRAIEKVKDLLGLYSLIRESNGSIIKLPDENYKAATKQLKKTAEEFRDIGIGEIGNPSISFGENNLNANTTFKKIGNVMVPLPNGTSFPVYTFTYKTKSVFLKGENYIKRFAVAVTQVVADTIKNEYEQYLVIKPITDKEITGPISQILGRHDLVFFEVDTSKISIISPEKSHEYILHNRELKRTVDLLLRAKLYNKYCNGTISELKSMASAAHVHLEESKQAFGLFAGMSPDYLEAIKSAGIDIYTGAYTKVQDVDTKIGAKANTEESEDTESKFEIEYTIKRMDVNKITFKMLSSPEIFMMQDKSPLIDERLLNIINKINSVQNIKDKYKIAARFQEEADKAINDCRRKLWAHKVAMYTLDRGNLHAKDKDKWIQNVKSRVQGSVYECADEGCEGLALILRGITL